jgi:chaperonin GroEL
MWFKKKRNKKQISNNTNKSTQSTIDLSYLKSNITDEEITRMEIEKTLKNITDCTCKSLGPYGATTIVEDTQKQHYMTKDGYTILNNLIYYYDIPKTVLDIVKKISKSLVRNVGDGSTSSVKIAYELFVAIHKIQDEFDLAAQDIINIFDEMTIIFEREIKNNSIEITEENFSEIIKRIATISVNNNVEAGQIVCDIFKEVGKYCFINLEYGKSKEDHYEIIDGVEIDRGYINQIMATEEDRLSFKYEKPVVFMCNDILDDNEMEFIINLIDEICLKKDIPLVIIAKSYSASFKSFFYANLQKNRSLPLIAIDMDCSTTKSRARFEDLALILDCKFYDKQSGMDTLDNFNIETDLGAADLVSGDDLHTKFIGGFGYSNNQEKINNKIDELSDLYEEYSKIDDEHDRSDQLFQIKKRIAMLQCSMATLYVGGNSDAERKTRKFLLEDAVYACRSSIDKGYIVGGNLALPKVIYKNEEKIVCELMNSRKLSYMSNIFRYDADIYNCMRKILQYVNEAFLSSYETVLTNAHISKEKAKSIIDICLQDDMIYNVKLRRYENDSETLVINSTDTDIQIIKSSFSIISLLATSNQFLSINAISVK